MAPPTTLPPRPATTQNGLLSHATLQPRPQTVAPIPPPINAAGDDQSVGTNVTTTTGGDLSSITTNKLVVVFKTKGNLYLVKVAVTTHLFPKIKFIASKDDLDYSVDKNSISQIILTNLNIPPDTLAQIKCWAQIKYYVPLYMNRKRTAVTLALRNKFKGMSPRAQRRN